MTDNHAVLISRRRRLIKAAAVLIAVGYCSLLAYQGGTFQESRRVVIQVPDLSIESVTKNRLNDSVKSKNVTLDDIFIGIMTTRRYQYTRLPVILQTWFQLAKNQTWFFTDIDNEHYQKLTNNHTINTKCGTSHGIRDLCCKLSVEYDHFLASNKKWYCHFDDDNYVNVPRLVVTLQRYNHQQDWYLGRNSIFKPLRVRWKPQNKATYWFATGGAGYCISKSLALKMSPIISGGRLISVCDNTRLPNDVTMGYVIENLVNKNFTLVPEFHSHLEQMKLLDPKTFKDQISFSYSSHSPMKNVVRVPGFNTDYDPTRFLSLHCFLFPDFKFCPR